MDFILADKNKKELGEVELDMDMDIGDTNDYKFSVSLNQWESLYSQVAYIYIPDTEYGGPVSMPKTMPSSNTVDITGDIWRKMLSQKIIEPPEGSAYRVVSGDANAIIRGFVNEMFSGLFSVPETDSGIQITSYQFDRYTDLLTGLSKMLAAYGARLDIKLRQGERHGFTVEVRAVPVADYSERLEYSQDSKVKFTTKDYTRGINHLICLGQGRLTDRMVIHLYTDVDGNISQTQTIFGEDERTSVYDYGSAETEAELLKGGIERLESLKNYKEMKMEVDDIKADIGDIVGGREYTTGFFIKQEISQKIIKIERGRIETQYKVGGKAKSVSRVSGGSVNSDDVLTFDMIYPVGSIYMSVNDVNPGDLFCGTWVAWGSGRVPVGVNSSDSSFNTAEKTGGAKTTTLTVDQLPSHSHEEKISYYANNIFIRPMATALSEQDSGPNKILKGDATYRSSSNGPLHTGDTGSGKSHNNLQPYITCYMWKRTA